jgi:NitT/TauT family transport system substrate-binding protein
MKGWFEQEMPGEQISWTVTGNAAAVREAVLAGRLDGGFMGIPPYLIAKDRGMQWTAVGGIAEARLGLTTVRSDIADITDIPANMRIALPSPGASSTSSFPWRPTGNWATRKGSTAAL